MGKTSSLFASSLPRLASGIVYSADSGFRAQIKAGASERERVYASDLAEYVDRDTAMLRAHTVFKLSEKLGVGVEQFSFGLYRFCAVEPSYVVVLAPMLDDQVFDDWLMPVTKQEKQLMVRNGSGPFPDPAVASAGRERILPFLSGSDFLQCAESPERFVRHAGHVVEEVDEEFVRVPDGTVKKGFSVRRVVVAGYFLYWLYSVMQILCLIYVLGCYVILTGDVDPVENTWGFILEPFRAGAITPLKGFSFTEQRLTSRIGAHGRTPFGVPTTFSRVSSWADALWRLPDCSTRRVRCLSLQTP